MITEIADIGGGPSYSIYETVINLAIGGALNDATSFYAGVFAGTFDAAIANGASLEAAANLALASANSAFATSEFSSDNPFKGAQKAYSSMMFAFKNYSSGNAFGRPGYNNSQLAKHGIDVGAKMMTSSSYSADGQINFDFSKTAVESAMSGTGTAMGMGKNANAASSYTAVITLDEAEVLAPASMVMVLTRSRGNPIFFGIGLGLFLREVYDGFVKWNPGYSHKKREDWRNSEKARKQSLEHLNIQSRNGMKNDIFGNGPNGGPPLGMLPSAYFGMRAIQLIYQYFDNTDVKMPQKPVDNGEQQISPNDN